MNALLAVAAAAVLCLCLPCQAEDTAASNAAPAEASAPRPPAEAASGAESSATAEPNVRHIVIEDDGSRIEELRVRGTTQRITVTPKVITHKSYEIITGDGSRDLGEGANTSRGAAGKRVWNVLQF
jgi:hypothetical protein